MGTAGHIDHGKTTLITALTGINPDRLQEEQFRGMTLDLGFAWFTLPAGNIGIVDVPGHHRLVKNMLAGIGQLDFVLLIIAADDGWMPQTQEHVDILHLYGVRHGVVALTKVDLVEKDWLQLVQIDIQERLAPTTLADSPIIPVSAVSGYNLETLKQALDTLASTLPAKPDLNDPLLWIDRVFTIKGAGTIITGTLKDGQLEAGQEIMIEPLGRRARVRGLQTQTKTVPRGLPQSRLAVNLTGVEKDELARGMYLCLPQKRPHYSLINAFIQLLESAPSALKNGQRVKLYVGTQETLTGIRVLGAAEIGPGQNGYVQLELENPAHFSFGDRFILRHSEQQKTLGGGQFIEKGIPVRGTDMRLVGPRRLDHLFPFEKPEGYLDLKRLEQKHCARGEDLSLLVAEERTFWTSTQFAAKGLPIPSGLLQLDNFLMAPKQFLKLRKYLEDTIEMFHKENPLAPGLSKETLRAAIGVPSRLFDQVLRQIPSLQEKEGALSKKNHKVRLSAAQEKELARLLNLVEETAFEPPALSVLEAQGFSRQLIFGGSHLGRLVLLPTEQVTTPKILDRAWTILWEEEAFQKGFELTVFRDRFKTSRKHALAFLEYFDAQGLTIRKGDVRFLSKPPFTD